MIILFIRSRNQVSVILQNITALKDNHLKVIISILVLSVSTFCKQPSCPTLFPRSLLEYDIEMSLFNILLIVLLVIYTFLSGCDHITNFPKSKCFFIKCKFQNYLPPFTYQTIMDIHLFVYQHHLFTAFPFPFFSFTFVFFY